MTTLIIDSHRLVNDLEEKHGFTRQQAEGVKHVLDEIQLDHLATKSDIEQLKLGMKSTVDNLRAELFKWLVPLLIGQAAFFATIDKWLF